MTFLIRLILSSGSTHLGDAKEEHQGDEEYSERSLQGREARFKFVPVLSRLVTSGTRKNQNGGGVSIQP